MVVYLGNLDCKAKKDGRPIHIVKLAEVIRDLSDDGQVYVFSRTKEFFTDNRLDGLDDLIFGDIVSCDFQQSAFLGAAPSLVGVSKVKDSPYAFDEDMEE